LGDGRDRQSWGVFCGQVFQRVYSRIHTPVPQSLLELMGKEPLTANLGQRLIDYQVALGGDDHFLAVKIGSGIMQFLDDVRSLPAGKGGRTGGKNYFLRHRKATINPSRRGRE
jgi:hypothetical protein